MFLIIIYFCIMHLLLILYYRILISKLENKEKTIYFKIDVTVAFKLINIIVKIFWSMLLKIIN